jgi:hypothetical protein
MRPHRDDARGPVDEQPVVSLEAVELTTLTGWTEAVAEALVTSPDRLNTILDDARAGAPWSRRLGIGEPSPALASVLENLACTVVSGTPTVDAESAATDERPRNGDYGSLVRRPPLEAQAGLTFPGFGGRRYRGDGTTSGVLIAGYCTGRPPIFRCRKQSGADS